MTELLASSGPIGDAAWMRMIGDVGSVESWTDETCGARIAGPRVHVTAKYVAAFVGRLVGEPGGRSPEAQLVDCYERLGARGIRELEGEVAFVLWDRQVRKLVAACDAVGTVALAFARSAQGVVVSSRALALLRDASVRRDWDQEYLADVLCDVRSLRPGATPFAAIRRLKPGFSIVATGDRIDESEVDRLDLEPARRSSANRADVAHELGVAIARAVAQRSAGVNACVSLSGGLDSSIIAACAAKKRTRLDVFSLTWSNAEDADERHLVARLVGHYAQMDLHAVDIIGEASEDHPLELPDDPITTAPALSGARLALMRAVRDAGFDTVLDGEGGDEVFDLPMRLVDLLRGGEVRAFARYLGDHGASYTSLLWGGVASPSLPPWLGASWRGRERRRSARIPPWMTSSFRDAETTRRAFEQPYRAPGNGFHEAMRSLLASGSTVAAWQALARNWRGHGVAQRSPFLDRRVIELVGRAPATMRLDPKITKPLLRDVARGLVPDEIRLASKQLTSYEHAFREGLAYRTMGDVVRQARECAALCEKLDVSRLAAALAVARAQGTAWRRELFALCDFLKWHARLRREYGID